MKGFLEKDKALGIDLINGLLKYWPITCPAKEVVYVNEIEEILETVGPEIQQYLLVFQPGSPKGQHCQLIRPGL